MSRLIQLHEGWGCQGEALPPKNLSKLCSMLLALPNFDQTLDVIIPILFQS